MKQVSKQNVKISAILAQSSSTEFLEEFFSSVNKPLLFIAIGLNSTKLISQVVTSIDFVTTHFCINQRFPKDVFQSDHYWAIETESREEFLSSIDGLEVPIDSNVLLYTGDVNSHLDLWDVYRPHTAADLK